MLRASKLKDHKIGRSPSFLKTKSGEIFRELFKVDLLPKTIGLRNDLRTVGPSPSALFIFYFSIHFSIGHCQTRDDNDMPLLCLTMCARAKLRCRRRLCSFL